MNRRKSQKKKLSKKLEKRINNGKLKKIIYAIVVFLFTLILSLVIAYFSLLPKFKIYPDTYFDPKDPLSVSFIFENEGALPIYNVDYQFFIRKALSNSYSIEYIFMKTDELPVSELSPGQSFSDFIVFPFKITDNQSSSTIKDADIDIVITYRSKFYFWKETISRRFTTKKEIDGNIKWIFAKPLNDIPPEGKRTVFIYSGKRKY